MGDAHVHCGTRRDVATLANLVLWWWEGLRDVATLANLVLCMVEGRRGGEGEG